jgi:triple functional domain protein
VQGKIVAQGKLLLRGPLLCTEDPNSGPNYKFKEMTVFLFEQIMIFAETVGKKTQFTSPVYTYKAHIQVNTQFTSPVYSTSTKFIWR